MPDTMDLYGFWRSQATFRLRVALNMKGVAYREIPVDLDGGAQNEPAFKAINPLGSVPALMVGERALTQSMAVLEYLEEIHPDPALLPKASLERARVRALAAIAIADSHPLIVPRVKRYLAAEAGFDAARWKAWQTHFFTAGLEGYEARLAAEPETGRFCHGEAPTFADIGLVGLMAGAEAFGIPVADVPTVDRIVAECRKLEPFDRARAQNQADFPG